MSERTSLDGMRVWWSRRWVRGPVVTVVIVIASAMALLTEFSIMLLHGERPVAYVGLILSALGLGLILRQRWLGLILTVAGAVASALLAVEYVGFWTVTVFASFLFARQGRGSLAGAGVTSVIIYIALVARVDGRFDDPTAFVAATFCLAAAAAGTALRLQIEAWDAEHQRAIDIEAARVAQLHQAVSDERLRIARDLHDVLGHEFAVVNINVGVAEVSLPEGADDARHALQAARASLQRTLQETQHILDLLRSDDVDAQQRAELASLDHIAFLLDRVRATGMVIESSIDHAFPDVDAEVSVAAYRIVQEALTNAGRHGAGPVQLSIRSHEDRLVIDLANRPALSGSAAPRVTGYGIVGMRERTQSAGGSITITPTAEMFRVHVELPTKASDL